MAEVQSTFLDSSGKIKPPEMTENKPQKTDNPLGLEFDEQPPSPIDKHTLGIDPAGINRGKKNPNRPSKRDYSHQPPAKK